MSLLLVQCLKLFIYFRKSSGATAHFCLKTAASFSEMFTVFDEVFNPFIVRFLT